MKPFFFSFAAICLLSNFVTHADPQASGDLIAGRDLISGIQRANMDTTIRPQDDFYKFSNGTWLRDVPIPADRSSYGVDTIMAERSLLQQRELIEAVRTSNDPASRKVGGLYASFMDEDRIEREKLKPLQAQLRHIGAIDHIEDIGPLIAHFGRIGINSPI